MSPEQGYHGQPVSLRAREWGPAGNLEREEGPGEKQPGVELHWLSGGGVGKRA